MKFRLLAAIVCLSSVSCIETTTEITDPVTGLITKTKRREPHDTTVTAIANSFVMVAPRREQKSFSTPSDCVSPPMRYIRMRPNPSL